MGSKVLISIKHQSRQFSSMKNALLSTLIFISCSVSSFGQVELPFEVHSSNYELVKRARAFFDEKEYQKATESYLQSSEFIQYFPFEQYRFAIALWKVNDTIEAQKVFYTALKSGLDFKFPYYFDACPLVKELSANEVVYEIAKQTSVDSSCAFIDIQNRLLELRVLDQGIRQGGLDTNLTMTQVDSITRIGLREILLEVTWPGFDEVGDAGEGVAFLIAQHSDMDVEFQKQCLDLMTVEFYKSNITFSSYAMIIDRYLVNTDQKQIFGTQMHYDATTDSSVPELIEYPEEVDFLRSLFGLSNLADYVATMNNGYH